MFKAGASFTYLDQRASTPLEFGGSFTFAPLPAIPASFGGISSLDAFALGLPALYVQGFGNSAGPFAYQELSAFGQDDWRLEPRLTVRPAAVQADLAGRRHDGHRARRHSTALRVSAGSEQSGAAARGLCRFGWHGRTSFDGAYGLFYGSQLAAILGSQIVFDGSPDGVRLLVLPFPASVAAWRAPDIDR